ncbi:MAG: hypothetical protein KGM24_06645 [Elusimicrobia bacterium]|nr:hypothetical protein [Elusimicrobiota bacterium]
MRGRRALAAAAALLAFVYVSARVDLYLRARSAYLEGEKYLDWNAHPEKKAAFYDAAFAKRRAELDRELAAGRLTKAEHDRQVELARFARDQAVSESSLKYAYVWFQSAAELFSPPDDRWTLLAREKMASTRALWKKQLDAEHVPYKDYMLQ